MQKSIFLKKLGAHIAKLRKARGLSQDHLYAAGGFSRGTLSKIENGLVDPQAHTLFRIAKVIGVSFQKLLDFE